MVKIFSFPTRAGLLVDENTGDDVFNSTVNSNAVVHEQHHQEEQLVKPTRAPPIYTKSISNFSPYQKQLLNLAGMLAKTSFFNIHAIGREHLYLIIEHFSNTDTK